MSRDKTVCMLRVKNEGRWIYRSLESIWNVASQIVIWDDGSTDNTEVEALRSLGPYFQQDEGWGVVAKSVDRNHPRDLHILRSPFVGAVRTKQRVNEIRDKNFLWSYTKTCLEFDYVLCLDGDEMLSNQAIRDFKQVWDMLDAQADVVTIPFLYLWDAENQIRVDGIYGSPGDGMPQLRFPRVFTVKRCTDQVLFDMCFRWEGTAGGFHCGSIPQQAFQTELGGSDNVRTVNIPVVHFGYIDNPLRQLKFEFYNRIDPNNEFEGCYKHIIGEPDIWAPGPVQVAPWNNE